MKLFPLFPLNTVLFPGLPLYLHIFEERYKLMMREVMEKDRTFGVLLIRSGQEANSALAQTYPVGCTARLIRVETLPDGNMNLSAIGEERFKVLSYDHDFPYLRASVESLPIEILGQPESFKESSGSFRRIILRYLEQLREVAKDQNITRNNAMEDELKLPEDPFRLLMAACAVLQVPLVEKQHILELDSMEAILQTTVRLFQREYFVNQTLRGINDEEARKYAQLN